MTLTLINLIILEMTYSCEQYNTTGVGVCNLRIVAITIELPSHD